MGWRGYALGATRRYHGERDFREKHGVRFKRVCDYYQYVRNRVELMDISPFVPELTSTK